MPSPEPAFIDFEGIDGSGKTTLSNRIADYLNSRGIPVHHARDKGIFRSKISRAIRDLTRDPSFLRMTDVTELLLYVARDAQMIDEYIRPKLKPGQVVFSDRYLYSAITHCHHARGLSRQQVDAVIDVAAGGLWPDLVVYCDVDPLTSRVRKKIQKVKDRRKSGDFGRKGLMGIGFREDMRRGYFALAKESPETWLVIDNAHSTIEESLQRIYDRIERILEQKGYPPVEKPGFADLASVDRRRGDVSQLEMDVRELLAIENPEARIEQASPVVFSHLQRLAEHEPAHAALFVTGLDNPASHQIRERVIDKEPEMVAYGLRGLPSDEAMAFRERLMAVEPVYVARSVSGMSRDPRAIALREKLAEVVPEQVALALRGNDTEEAWELRGRLRKIAPEEILLSLRGIDSDRAWEIRTKRAKKREFRPMLLESLGGIDSDGAWKYREELAEEFMPWVLLSLRGLTSDRSWKWREEHVSRAPKIIMKTIGRSDDPRAWELREMAKFYAKEVLDSISGLDNGLAWQLRTSLSEKWPNTCVSSLGAGNQSERAWKFRWDQLRANSENVLLLKHLAKAALRSQDLDQEFEADEDEDADFT